MSPNIARTISVDFISTGAFINGDFRIEREPTATELISRFTLHDLSVFLEMAGQFLWQSPIRHDDAIATHAQEATEIDLHFSNFANWNSARHHHPHSE